MHDTRMYVHWQNFIYVAVVCRKSEDSEVK